MPIITPGAYIKHRRTAAGLTPRDVAALVTTEPHLALHQRAELIELIEADAQPASFATIVALRRAVPFSLAVLERLVGMQLGFNTSPPRLCRICAWSADDPADPFRRFAEPNLCTVCAPLLDASDRDFDESILAEHDRILATPLAGRSEA